MSQPWLPLGTSTRVAPDGVRWSTPSVDNPPSGIKSWDGSRWPLYAVRVWDGTDWPAHPVKYWDGTEWALAGL